MKRFFSSSTGGSPLPSRNRSRCGPSAPFSEIGIREVHVDGPVAAREHAPRSEERPEGLLLLLLARDLAPVRFLLRDAPVMDRDRDQVEVAPDATDERVHDRRQHAELRRQDLPRPRPSPFDEELLRVAFADEEREVLPEDHLVEVVVLERPPDEECARTAEERTHRPEVEVVARGDVRRGEIVHVKM
jgi:hypothetical protein